MNPHLQVERLRSAIERLEVDGGGLPEEVRQTALSALRRRLSEGAALRTTEARRQATVLFVELPGFTRLSADLDPEVARDRLDRLWETLDAIVARAGGRIDKHSGATLMALFGIPRARGDDAERAVDAALEIQRVAQGFDEDLGGAPRIGIHSGLLMLTSVGSGEELTAIGDTVNLASRLQHAARAGEVLVSQTTWRLVSRTCVGEPLPSIPLKGKAAPIGVHRILGPAVSGVQEQLSREEGVRFVGRKDALARLVAAFETMRQTGEASIWTVLAEPGLGKTRFARELHRHLSRRHEGLVVRAVRAHPSTHQAPYQLLREWLFLRLDLTETPLDELTTTFLREAAALPGGSPVRAVLIARLLGLSDLPPASEDRGRASTEAAFEAVAVLLEGAAASLKTPLLAVVDDLHRADRASLELVEFLIARCAKVPLMFIALARPEFVERCPTWAHAAGHHRFLSLDQLSDDESDRLLRLQLAHSGFFLPVEQRRVLVRAAAGSPYFLEEMAREVASGNLREGDDGNLSPVPGSLATLLQTRLDRIPAYARSLAGAASVIGTEFTRRSLMAVRPDLSETSIDEGLKVLLESDLIHRLAAPRHPGTTDFAFASGLLHQVVSASVLRSEARSYHRAMATFLEQLEGSLEPRHVAIAQHREAAGETLPAARAYDAAAILASQRLSHTAVIEHLEKVVQLVEPGGDEHQEGVPLRLSALHRLAGMVGRLGRLSRAAELHRRALVEAQVAGDLEAELSARQGLSLVAWHQGDPARSWEEARESMDLAARIEVRDDFPVDDDELQRIVGVYDQAAWSAIILGHQPEVSRASDRMATLAAGFDDPQAELRATAEVARLRAIIDLMEGHLSSALEKQALAVELIEELGEQELLARVLVDLLDTELLGGRLEEAESTGERLTVLARRIGDEAMLVAAELFTCYREVLQGDLASAIESIRTLERRATEDWYLRPILLALKFHVGVQTGDELTQTFSACLDLLQNAKQYEVPIRSWRILGNGLWALGTALEYGGETIDARSAFERALEASAAIPGGLPCEHARTLEGYSRWAARAGLANAEGMELEAATALLKTGLLPLPDSAFPPDR